MSYRVFLLINLLSFSERAFHDSCLSRLLSPMARGQLHGDASVAALPPSIWSQHATMQGISVAGRHGWEFVSVWDQGIWHCD